jgi:hypothetical protein
MLVVSLPPIRLDHGLAAEARAEAGDVIGVDARW